MVLLKSFLTLLAASSAAAESAPIYTGPGIRTCKIFYIFISGQLPWASFEILAPSTCLHLGGSLKEINPNLQHIVCKNVPYTTPRTGQITMGNFQTSYSCN